MIQRLLAIIFFSLTFGLSLVAQTKEWRPRYTSRWEYLLRSPGDKASIIGVLSTNASVLVLDSTQTHYHVEVNNGDRGYISRQLLTTGMYGNRSDGEPVQYFYRGEQGLQSPHKYVQVSELRVRDQPSTAGKAVKKLRLNEMVFLDYYPLGKDAWVYIGDHFREEPEYIQVKYLGNELTYASVLKDYLASRNTNLDSEVSMAGRLREMAWDTEGKNLLEGLTFYKETMQKVADQPAKVDVDFELMLAKSLQNYLTDIVKYEKALAQLNISFEVNGQKLVNGLIGEGQVKAMNMERVRSIPDFPECGWDPLFYYKSTAMVVPFEETENGKVLGTIYSLGFEEGASMVMGGVRLDQSSSEEEFLSKFGRLISVSWNTDPHVYYIGNGDAGRFIFTFQNGKLIKFDTMYFC